MNPPKRILCALLLSSLPFTTTVAQQLYKWVDKDGKVHYTDSIPPDQVNQGRKELTKQGRVAGETEAALTTEQRLAREQELARQKAEQKLYADQKRRDQTLLATYSSESDIDLARARNLEPVDGRIKSAMQRLKDLEVKEKQIAEEMEFCLLCRNCESVCPSGVHFGAMMEHTRDGLARTGVAPRKGLVRFAFDHVLKKRWMLRFATRAGRTLQLLGTWRIFFTHLGKHGRMLADVPDIPPARERRLLPATTPAVGDRRGTAAVLDYFRNRS